MNIDRIFCQSCGRMLLQVSPGCQTYVCPNCGAVVSTVGGYQEKLGRIIYEENHPAEFIYTCRVCHHTDYYPIRSKEGTKVACPSCHKSVPNDILIRVSAAYDKLQCITEVNIQPNTNVNGRPKAIECYCMDQKCPAHGHPFIYIPQPNDTECDIESSWNIVCPTCGSHAVSCGRTYYDVAGCLNGGTYEEEDIPNLDTEDMNISKEDSSMNIDLNKIMNALTCSAKEFGKIAGRAFNKYLNMGKEFINTLPQKMPASKSSEIENNEERSSDDLFLVIAPTLSYRLEMNKQKIDNSEVVRSYYYEEVESRLNDVFGVSADKLKILWYNGWTLPMKDVDAQKRLFDNYRDDLDNSGHLVFCHIKAEEVMNFSPFFTLIQLAQADGKPVYIL